VQRSGRHIVLHDLDAILVLKVNSSDLIKSDTIPKTDKSDLTSAHVVEKIGNRRLPARHENTVRRDLLVQMRFSGASWTKFTEIEIILHQRQHPVQKQPLLTVRELIRLHTGGTKQDINPLFLSERFSPPLQFFQIDMWHLHRCKRANANR
jgi:hypothetical protein